MEYEELDDLKYIKKHYGEKMSHLCRELFPSILECPGLLYHIISSHFYPNKSLYKDIDSYGITSEFKDYIYSFIDIEENTNKNTVSVKELLESVGYDLYECKSHEDVLSFEKYYADGEKLCTFNDPYRILNNYIFFIVKKNVSDIKREDFESPKREDEYGVSILDLQFDRGNNQRISIKSRYNHTVSNPDATYSNNLDKIVPGLTDAFINEYGFNIGKTYSTNFYHDDYILANDDKFYRYNIEINNIHYCKDNIIIDHGRVIDDYIDKGRYTLFDYFVLDHKEKKIFLYDESLDEDFIKLIGKIIDIKITKENNNERHIHITYDNKKKAIIKLDENNLMIGYYDENITNTWWLKNFLGYNFELKELSLPNLEYCGSNFMFHNRSLTKIDMPNLVYCGNNFLYQNISLRELYMPKLESCGYNFLFDNCVIKEVNLPSITSIGEAFLLRNCSLKTLYMPNLKSCDGYFLNHNTELESIDLPELKYCKFNFLTFNKKIKEVNLPSLIVCGDNFLTSNKDLIKLELPSLEIIEDDFLYLNHKLKELYLPKVKEIGENFLFENEELEILDIPDKVKLSNEYIYPIQFIRKIKEKNGN